MIHTMMRKMLFGVLLVSIVTVAYNIVFREGQQTRRLPSSYYAMEEQSSRKSRVAVKTDIPETEMDSNTDPQYTQENLAVTTTVVSVTQQENEDDVTLNEGQTANSPVRLTGTSHVRLLVLARMTTGSKAISRFFSGRPDFFYAYEPGHMLLKFVFNGNVQDDGHANLERIQVNLRDLLHGIYHCNLTNHPYFIQGFNVKSSVYKRRAFLTKLPMPITEETLTGICKSRDHVIAKVVRMTDLMQFTQMLQNDDVKVLFLARDPRGMAASRHKRFLHAIDTHVNKSADGVRPLHPRLVDYVVEHCQWLETNYKAITEGSTWLQNNAMLVRYEDMAMYPYKVVPKMLQFVGINGSSPAEGYAPHADSVSKWRNYFSFDEVKAIQDLCSDRLYNMFGWKKVQYKSDFNDETNTFFGPIPKL
ncbi:carbohydrate sulfotransferase 3-like [Saccoglossus kowalevskii]